MTKEKELTFYEKLNRIQVEMKAHKGQMNTFGNYKYRSCEDILEAVKPLLEKYKLIISLTDELVLVGERYYIKASVIIFEGGRDLSHMVSAYARESLNKKGMDESQITGTASSYARKYALNGLLLIDDTKDADTQDNRETPIKRSNDVLDFVDKMNGNSDKYIIPVGKFKGQDIHDVDRSDLTGYVSYMSKQGELNGPMLEFVTKAKELFNI